MQKWFSYLLPVTQKITSKYNGIVEVTWYNGKKMLNTKNANYSYGSLQKILKIGLDEFDLAACQKILVLGLGGGSVIQTLREDFNYQKQLTAIDIDSVIIDIARDEFGILESDNLQIICDDAQLFMQRNTAKFDLIIVDLFIDTTVPSAFLKPPFWRDLVRASPNILCNAALQGKNDDSLKPVLNFLQLNGHNTKLMDQVNKTNTLLLVQKN